MLTKELIEELKRKGDGELARLVNRQSDLKSLAFILENLGALPEGFNGDFLLPMLRHDHPDIRRLAAKNIAKLADETCLPHLADALRRESNTLARREIVSALGRMRNPKCASLLKEALNDEDPKVVCQAIRGLLVFQGERDVDEALKPLLNHPNEIVRAIVERAFGDGESDGRESLPHSETFDFLKNVVVQGDVLDVLRHVPDESIHLTFTSPPYYNARDYSIYPSYDAYLEFLAATFKEVHRVTKEGRFLVVNTSPIIIPRVSRAHSSKRYPIPFDLHHRLAKNGWEFIDDIVWLKPESSVKNRIGGFMQHRKPLMYKPNAVTEYLMVYRKETTKLIDWNIRRYDQETVEASKVGDGYETTNVWRIDPAFDKVHSAVFPAELCKRVIQHYSFKGDLVFDPFAGSGTVGQVAKALGRRFFLTEKDPIYVERIKSKIEPSLFGEDETRFYALDEFAKVARNDSITANATCR
ncbi:MAG: DNA methyltransferase [Chloroherpetonaceae bacterium]|nr:DNA methyltransferase [Chloroherpetonaceae bacterium]MDW8438666.1 DNA methyltransferase [Chloroherpetonaceae bacterium]